MDTGQVQYIGQLCLQSFDLMEFHLLHLLLGTYRLNVSHRIRTLRPYTSEISAGIIIQ